MLLTRATLAGHRKCEADRTVCAVAAGCANLDGGPHAEDEQQRRKYGAGNLGELERVHHVSRLSCRS